VQCLHLHNVTKFGSTDLIVGDSKGTLTIFSNEQILNRRILSHGSITSLTVDEDFGMCNTCILLIQIEIPYFSTINTVYRKAIKKIVLLTTWLPHSCTEQRLWFILLPFLLNYYIFLENNTWSYCVSWQLGYCSGR
jgi:hypothetical protein